MVNATISTQAQITYIRHQPSYTQLGVKMKRAYGFYMELVTDITTRNGHDNTELQTLRQIIVQNAQNEPTILNRRETRENRQHWEQVNNRVLKRTHIVIRNRKSKNS